MLGQPGASTQTKAMTKPAQCARSIDAVLQHLDLRDVHLVGHSYGGWLATHTAALVPSRLSTLTLLDPAHTVARLSPQFWRSLALLLTRPHSARAEHAAAWVTGHPPPGSSIAMLTRLFLAGFAAFGPPRRTAPLLFRLTARCVRCTSLSRFCWHAIRFMILTVRFAGFNRWYRHGTIGCGLRLLTRCR